MTDCKHEWVELTFLSVKFWTPKPQAQTEGGEA